MNRSERRKYERKYGTVATMQRYRDEAIEEGKTIGENRTINTVLYMTAYTLNYKLGFGSKRLCEIMYSILDNIDAYRTGHLTPEDFRTIQNDINKLGFNIAHKV